MTTSFHYNDLPACARLFDDHPEQIAAVFLEPARTEPPRRGFLEGLRTLCTTHGAVLVFDEMITGFRYALHGAPAPVRRHPRPLDVRQGAGQRLLALGAVRQTRVDAPRQPRTRRRTTCSCSRRPTAPRRPRWQRRSPRWTSTNGSRSIEHLYRQGERLTAGLREVAASHGLADHVAPGRLSVQPAVLARSTRTASRRRRTARCSCRRRSGGACSCRRWSSATRHTTRTSIARSTRSTARSLVYAKALVDGTGAVPHRPPVTTRVRSALEVAPVGSESSSALREPGLERLDHGRTQRPVVLAPNTVVVE